MEVAGWPAAAAAAASTAAAASCDSLSSPSRLMADSMLSPQSANTEDTVCTCTACMHTGQSLLLLVVGGSEDQPITLSSISGNRAARAARAWDDDKAYEGSEWWCTQRPEGLLCKKRARFTLLVKWLSSLASSKSRFGLAATTDILLHRVAGHWRSARPAY